MVGKVTKRASSTEPASEATSTLQMDEASGRTPRQVKALAHQDKKARKDESNGKAKGASKDTVKKTAGRKLRAVKHSKPENSTNKASAFEDAKLEYASQEYWENRYAKGDDLAKNFEWFLSFSDIEPLLRNVIDFSDRTGMFIDLGCGTSMLLRDMKQSGYKGDCIGVDYSTKAVETMRGREDCRGIDFKVCDAREVDALFKGVSVVLDKSLMDTMLHNEDKQPVIDMLHSVARAMRPTGTFISITQMDPRKEEDLQFFQDVVLKNLRATYQSVASVSVHMTTPPAGDDRPVPTVIFYHFGPGSGKDNIEIDVIEYESSEDGENSD